MKQVLLGLLFISALVAATFQNCGQMRTYSAAELSSRAIGDAPPTTEEYVVPKTETLVRWGDRDFLEATIISIFGPHAISPGDNVILAQVASAIRENPTIVGGSCDLQIIGCIPYDSQAPIIPLSSPARQGVIHNTCSKATEYDLPLISALSNAGIASWNEPISNENIDKAYSLFYMGRPVTTDIRNVFYTLAYELRDKNISLKDQWRMIFLTLCISPDWQAI